MTYRSHFLIVLFACFSFGLLNVDIINSAYADQKTTGENPETNTDNIYGKVTEVLNVPSYTYAEVDTGKEKLWAAGPTTPLKIGDMVAFKTGMPMPNFHSQSLDRDFPVVYFISRFITDKASPAVMSSPSTSVKQKQALKPIKAFNKVSNGNTIAEIYAQKTMFGSKVIRVRGQVTKFSKNIMGKNWIHIVDNSTLDDLTVTTDSTAAIDDVVIVEGKLELDKDYGSGYVYPLIMENATITPE